MDKPPYHYNFTESDKKEFDARVQDLFDLGFKWDTYSGSFYLTSVWSAWWEQVCNLKGKEWQEYLVAIKKSINEKN